MKKTRFLVGAEWKKKHQRYIADIRPLKFPLSASSDLVFRVYLSGNSIAQIKLYKTNNPVIPQSRTKKTKNIYYSFKTSLLVIIQYIIGKRGGQSLELFSSCYLHRTYLICNVEYTSPNRATGVDGKSRNRRPHWHFKVESGDG